jgi:hypothetical protein
MRQPHANGESNCHVHANSYGHSDCNRNGHANSNSYSNVYANGNSNSYCYGHSYGYSNSNGDANCDCIPAAYADATTTAHAASTAVRLIDQ